MLKEYIVNVLLWYCRENSLRRRIVCYVVPSRTFEDVVFCLIEHSHASPYILFMNIRLKNIWRVRNPVSSTLSALYIMREVQKQVRSFIMELLFKNDFVSYWERERPLLALKCYKMPSSTILECYYVGVPTDTVARNPLQNYVLEFERFVNVVLYGSKMVVVN